MPILKVHHTLATTFGILGNVVSVGVFLAPVPTFYRIYKRKSSEGYQSLPYSVALFSAMLLLYYGSLKSNGILLITINSFGCGIEVLYLVMYLVYAPKAEKNFTLKLLALFNLGACSLVMVLTTFLAKGSKRTSIVGWINAVLNICVFAAPLGVMRTVIRTRSVEFMPISLSFALTLNATMWFFYGIFINDYYIAVPNILGFLLGLVQMIAYITYKCYTSKDKENSAEPEMSKDLEMNTDSKFHSADSTVKQIELNIVNDENNSSSNRDLHRKSEDLKS